MDIQNLAKNKHRLFWTLQLGGWMVWCLQFTLPQMGWGKTHGTYPLYAATISVVGLLLSLALRWAYKTSWDFSGPTRVAIVIGGSYLMGLVWAISRVFIYGVLVEAEDRDLIYAVIKLSIGAATVMLMWSAMYFGIKYYLFSQEQKERYLTLMSQAHEAQLKMLRYQLNPHFLFNTLNAISTLILDKETEMANGMVTKLSRFLRYSLDNDPMQEVTVKEEFDSLQLYLDIEKVRFAERLELSFIIDRQVATALMPSLLLQPLVENAIKYAISQAINGGAITVSAAPGPIGLRLVVADDGPGMDLKKPPPKGSGGVGLVNTRDRLQELYGSRHALALSHSDPHGLTITIDIPLSMKPTE